MIAFVYVQVQDPMKIIQRYRLITLSGNMKTIETMFVLDESVSAFFDEHLADLNITIKRRIVNRTECLIGCLHVYPIPYNILILILNMILKEQFLQ